MGMGDHKASGINSFDAKFFKSVWRIVGTDVKKSSSPFFKRRKMFLVVNCTLVSSLIPKKASVTHLRDMRPISCRTTIAKIISKNLANRLGKVSVVSGKQSIFIPGRYVLRCSIVY